MIPIDESEWTPVLGPKLPPGHKIDFAMTAEGEIIIRISGANAHVTGHSKSDIEEAVQAAFDWFKSVGSEL